MLTPTEFGEMIVGLLNNTFVGVIIGAVLTAYLIPKISKQWRKPKELELKMMVVSKMTESVTAIIFGTFLDMVTELMNDENFKGAQKKWENDKEGLNQKRSSTWQDSICRCLAMFKGADEGTHVFYNRFHKENENC